MKRKNNNPSFGRITGVRLVETKEELIAKLQKSMAKHPPISNSLAKKKAKTIPTGVYAKVREIKAGDHKLDSLLIQALSGTQAPKGRARFFETFAEKHKVSRDVVQIRYNTLLEANMVPKIKLPTKKNKKAEKPLTPAERKIATGSRFANIKINILIDIAAKAALEATKGNAQSIADLNEIKLLFRLATENNRTRGADFYLTQVKDRARQILASAHT